MNQKNKRFFLQSLDQKHGVHYTPLNTIPLAPAIPHLGIDSTDIFAYV